MSMSGVTISKDLTTTFESDFKIKHKISCMFLRLSDNQKEIIVDKQWDSDKLSYEQLVKEIPQNDCRFILYDYPRSHTDKCIIFISWVPGDAPIKSKMVYAATKEYVKKSFSGVRCFVQANEISDLEKDSIDEKFKK